jgi:hypothetical protein
MNNFICGNKVTFFLRCQKLSELSRCGNRTSFMRNLLLVYRSILVTQHMWLATFMQVRSRVPELSIRLEEK